MARDLQFDMPLEILATGQTSEHYHFLVSAKSEIQPQQRGRYTRQRNIMKRMTNQEWKEFLLEKPRPVIASVVRADGRPHATPVWVDMDGEQIIFTTGRDSLKGKALL